MSDYLLIHNPNCSKSRGTKEILDSKHIKYQVFNYLEEELTEDFLRQIFKALGKKAKDCIRMKESILSEISLDFDNADEVLMAIIKNPILLERPILLKGDKAVIGRPPENILELI